MDRISLVGEGDFQTIVQTIKQGVESSALTAECLQQVYHKVDDKEVMLLGFEKYYYRTGNQATLTVLITEGINHQIFVDAVSGGTSQGVLFKFDWGASKNFTKIVYDLLRPLRFDIKDSYGN